MNEDTDLLRAQLDEVLREQGDALEIAALAGLLARSRRDLPELERAEGWRHGEGAAALQAAWEACDHLALVDPLVDVDEEAEPEEAAAALFALDERCAAATWMEREEDVRVAAQTAAGMVAANPEAWQAQAPLAAALLSRTPPLPRDPAMQVWQAVREVGSRVGLVDTVPRELPLAVRLAAGLQRTVAIAEHAPVRMAAAEALPEDPPWTVLAAGEGWELALTADHAGEAVLVLAGEELPSAAARRDGLEQPPRTEAEQVVWAARPGEWRLVIGERELGFEVVL